MNEDLKGLSDTDLPKMSEALSKLPPPGPPADTGDPQRIARGRALADQNHCNICHRSDFTGQENVPRVADQREDYLFHTMTAYKTGARHAYDATMAEVLQPVDDNDLRARALSRARTVRMTLAPNGARNRYPFAAVHSACGYLGSLRSV